MTTPLIDLRSDTVTRPTPAMRAAMASAEVGDDVFADDPTVNHLQERVATLFGKASSLFVPSGTMANQLAVNAHCRPGDELLCETTCHVYTWEAGGPALLSGVTCRPIDGDYGLLDVSRFVDKIRPDNEHYVRTRLVCLENTHNRGGGRVYPQSMIQDIRRWADTHGLAMHLDGARIWNAHVASGMALSELCKPFDTVSVCFSKGLGAPVGSVLIGPQDLIARARRMRKILGGGMRQIGILAAAALHAMDHHIARLADDHRNAQAIAQAIREIPGMKLEHEPVETNLIWYEIDPKLGHAKDFAAKLRERGVLVHVAGPRTMRACTHLDVTTEQCAQAIVIFREVARRCGIGG